MYKYMKLISTLVLSTALFTSTASAYNENSTENELHQEQIAALEVLAAKQAYEEAKAAFKAEFYSIGPREKTPNGTIREIEREIAERLARMYTRFFHYDADAGFPQTGTFDNTFSIALWSYGVVGWIDFNNENNTGWRAVAFRGAAPWERWPRDAIVDRVLDIIEEQSLTSGSEISRYFESQVEQNFLTVR